VDWGFLQALEPYAQTTQVIQQLNSAAQQHQQFQQQQDLENRRLSLQQQMEQARVGQEQTSSDRNYQLQLHNAGAIPVGSDGNQTVPITTPGVPGLASGPTVNSSVPPPAGSLSARLGSQSYAIPPASYTQDQKDQRDISARLAEHPGFSLGDVGVSLGVGHDEKHTAEDWRSIADAHTALQKDNAPDKTNKPQLVTDDQGKLTFVGQDADGKPVVTPVTGAKG
jgi:hypothetical protein